MTTVHVRANQTTVDWAEGAEFEVERTPLVDNLIRNGSLTALGDGTPVEYTGDFFKTVPSQPYVTYRDEPTDSIVGPGDAPMVVLEADDDPDVDQILKSPRTRRKTT